MSDGNIFHNLHEWILWNDKNVVAVNEPTTIPLLSLGFPNIFNSLSIGFERSLGIHF